jgi:hypothetical protein
LPLASWISYYKHAACNAIPERSQKNIVERERL